MAKRYGRLPSEILQDQTIEDFNLNTAIMVCAMEEDANRQRQAQKKGGKKQGRLSYDQAGQGTGFSQFGIKHKTVSKMPKGAIKLVRTSGNGRGKR